MQAYNWIAQGYMYKTASENEVYNTDWNELANNQYEVSTQLNIVWYKAMNIEQQLRIKINR